MRHLIAARRPGYEGSPLWLTEQNEDYFTLLFGKDVLTIETNNATEWTSISVARPFFSDSYLDLSSHFEQLLATYACCAQTPVRILTRSLENLRTATLHRSRQVGLHTTEAFITLRQIL